jgi:NitT/TauT family transport system substrate-binding protein
MRKHLILTLVIIITFSLVSCKGKKEMASETKQVINVGYFPNITHSQALVGMARGIFQQYLGENMRIKTTIFNAGPSEIEAMYAGAIDLGYIGPSPAINGYIKSNGEALRIVVGATSGGASLVVQPELYDEFQKSGVNSLKGKKIASPQQGNTQDISLRHYLKLNNMEEQTRIVPITNPEQLIMFSRKEIDGAWAPEPWASRLVKEVGGKRLIDEREIWPNKQFCTAHIIVSTKFLKEHPDLVKKWLEAHCEITKWINANPQEAQTIANAEIEKLTTKKLPAEVLAEAWQMLDITINPVKSSIYTFADMAYEQGFLGETKPDLSNIYDLTILNEIANTKY